MTLVAVDPVDEQIRLGASRDRIARIAPDLSSAHLLTRGQRVTFGVLLGLVVVGLVLAPLGTGTVLVGIATAVYCLVVAHRIVLTLRSLRDPRVVRVSDDEARAVADVELPVYTVLVPLYREHAVVPDLVAHLHAIEYPADRLDVKLLVEADDEATLLATLDVADPRFEVLVVPDGEPRTKPRALNYGLTFARGEFVTIYDAEDQPEPLQLRRAVVAFGRLPDSVGCLQAELAYWNADQNLITRLFTVEYLQWFRLLLPGLGAGGAPVPLGGTSNHLRRDLLERIGAWDPYNVTEDADLGIRLHRAGYVSGVLESATLEEANSDYVNWNSQRSRWYKGYLQTWLVHLRRPSRLLDELGWSGFLQFNGFIGGTPVMSLLNLVFWGMTLAWFVGRFAFIQALYPPAIYYPALFCFVFGNFAMAYLYVLAARSARRPSLVWAACLVPVYWLMMGIAALKAVWQLAVARSYWEKTVHGLAAEGEGAEPTVDVVAAERASRAAVRTAPDYVVPDPEELSALAAELGRPGDGAPGRSVTRLARPLQALGWLLVVFTLYVIVFSGVGVSDPAPAPRGAAPPAGSRVAVIAIPSIGVSTPVVEGLAAEDLRGHVGHVRGSALPGRAGATVLVGARYTGGAVFGKLSLLRRGDTVTLEQPGGASARYEITGLRTVDRDALAVSGTGPARVVLVTGASAVDPARLLVARGALVAGGMPGTRAPGARTTVPGADYGAALLALLAVAFAAYAWRTGRRLTGRFDARLVTVVTVIVVIVSVYAAFRFGARALPPTY